MQVIGLLTLLLSCEVVVVVGMEEVLANDGVGGGSVHAAATLATGGHRITSPLLSAAGGRVVIKSVGCSIPEDGGTWQSNAQRS